MEDSVGSIGIKIPICDSNRGEKDRVIFYPDELPEDHQVLSDVLRAVFAPFKVWRNCALEYHRQGFDKQFEQLLMEIVAALDDPDIDKLYQEQDKEDYSDGIVDIFLTLAAKALSDFSNAKRTPHSMPESSSEYSRKFVEYLKSADEKQRLNEYTWLIKGFFEIAQGDLRRAEDQFRYVHERATKGQTAARKKYLFGSLVGLGLVSYASLRYDQAVGYFVKAVQTNPGTSGASVRMAVALCCFKLEQYDRARVALEKCLSIDPSDPNALVLLALVEQVTAKKDRSKRQQCHAQALELTMIASAVDPTNAQALNILANHHFHSWRSIEFNGSCQLLDTSHVLLPSSVAPELIVPRNLLRFGQSDVASSFIIVSVEPFTGDNSSSEQAEYSIVGLSSPIPQRLLAQSTTCSAVDIKDLASVERLAHQAMIHATQPALIAESNYILGKVAHSLRDANLAFDFYWKALKDAPDMVLAAFGAAQILFSRKEFSASLELFEKVLSKTPDDKDTQAYVMLLKAIMRQEQAPFDRLREIAPGFQHESDLWLIQGQLRQSDPSEHKHALKCFLNAKECLEANVRTEGGAKVAVPAAVLSNISVLHHSLGKLGKALEFSKMCLAAVHTQSTAKNADHRSVFRSADLEGVFYEWARNSVCSVRAGTEPNQFFLGEGQSADLSDHLVVGDDVMIGGVLHTVESIASASEMVATSPVRLSSLAYFAQGRADAASGASYEVRVKHALNNFVDESITYCYNFARLLEDEGNTRAATEIYIELLKRHPSFMECYLRLSMISCDLGKFDEASVWLSRALAVNEDEAEATLCLGDLYNRSSNLDDAKRCYDKICSSKKHDSRALLSLGNFYFAHSASSKSDSQLKESYKFFFHVLNENHCNAFAANGLGMVCVKKNELDVARETFSKAREANVAMSEDICTNLAHVYVLQNRSVDAERLYQATIRSLSRSGRCFSDKPAALNECVSFVQFKSGRFDEASHSILRAIHMNPTNLRFWYNAAFVGQGLSNYVLSKHSSTAAAIEDAKSALLVAKKIFKHLGAMQHQTTVKPYDRKFASTNSSHCSLKLQSLEQLLHAARARETAEETEKRRRDEDHNALLKTRSDLKEKEASALEMEKQAKQQAAEEKEKKLQELREKWMVTVSEQSAGRSKASKKEGGADGGGKKRRRGQKGQDAGDGEKGDEEGDEQDEELMRVLTGNGAKSNIDFGSSGEDSDGDAEVTRPTLRSARSTARTAAPVDDLFGDSDEEDQQPARKRLHQKGAGGLADSDEDDAAMDVDASAPAPGDGADRARKQQRVIDDDSDN